MHSYDHENYNIISEPHFIDYTNVNNKTSQRRLSTDIYPPLPVLPKPTCLVYNRTNNNNNLTTVSIS